MGILRGTYFVTIALALSACTPGAHQDIDDYEFRSLDGSGSDGSGGDESTEDGGLTLGGGDDGDGGLEVHNPPKSGGGGWFNNGLDDPEVGGIDTAYGLSTPAGIDEASVDLDTLAYTVECALEADDSIDVTIDDETTTLSGLVGLAPQWRDGACDKSCQEWVSACLLARTNVSEETVDIWVQADHPAIGFGHNPEEPVYEASFYGNLFEDPDAGYYCKGSARGLALARLEGRTCTQGNTCGFTKFGKCKKHSRCEKAAPGVWINCKSGHKNNLGPSYNTLAVFVPITEDDD